MKKPVYDSPEAAELAFYSAFEDADLEGMMGGLGQASRNRMHTSVRGTTAGHRIRQEKLAAAVQEWQAVAFPAGSNIQYH